jgi:hypothetical protein
MFFQFEDMTVIDADSLEYAVTVKEAMIVYAYLSFTLWIVFAVNVDQIL